MGVKVAGLGWRMTQSVALILFIWSCQILPLVKAKATAHCVQVGQVEFPKKGIAINQKPKSGPFTNGGERFECKDCSRLDWIYSKSTKSLNEEDEKKGKKSPPSDAFENYHNHGFDKMTCAQGGFKFSTKVGRAVKGWDQVFYIYTDVCSTQLEIRTYLVSQGGKILRGWLYFEVELTKPVKVGDEMEYIYVQIRDEAFNAIGEFVSDETEQCPRSKNKELISPTKYQVLPCSATGKREAKTANALFVAKRSQYLDQSLVSDGYILKQQDLTKGITFTWRLNEYWCNRHQKIRLDANVWTTSAMNNFNSKGKRNYYLSRTHIDSNHRATLTPNTPEGDCGLKFKNCRLQRKISDWLYPRWFGAADIKLDGQLECSTPVFKNAWEGDLSDAAISSWIGSSSKLTIGEDYLHPDYGSYNSKIGESTNLIYYGCQVNPYPPSGQNQPMSYGKSIVTFGGRCIEHNEKKVSHNQTQGCNDGSGLSKEFEGVDWSNFPLYSKYSQDLLANRTKQCEQPCKEPDINNPEDLKEIKSYAKDDKSTSKAKSTVNFRTLSGSRLNARRSTFWQTRKYHGIVCVVCVMFLMPVSIFFIRYYKETFMSSHGLGCGPWFWLHLLMPFAVLTLYLSGHKAMEQPIQNFGTSQSPAGNFHRVAGKGFIYLFCAMGALGVIRPLAKTARAVCCALHSIIGFFLYFLSVGLVVNSTYIPGSPSLDQCDEKDQLPTGYSWVAIIPCVWLGIDVLFHCFMTALQFAIDRRYKLERPGFGLPFIPILPSSHLRDLVGARFRKLMLLLYVTLALTFTLVTTHQLFVKDDDPMNCTLGVMSCNLSETRPNQKSSPFGCNVLALKYYNKIVIKYNITQ